MIARHRRRRDKIFAYKNFGGVTRSRDAAWRALVIYASRTRQAASRDSVTLLQFNTNTGRFLARMSHFWCLSSCLIQSVQYVCYVIQSHPHLTQGKRLTVWFLPAFTVRAHHPA